MLPTHPLFSCWHRQVAIKNIFFDVSLSHQIPNLGLYFQFSSKHIGVYWLLDTCLGIDKMKNALKSVIASVISFSLFTDRVRNIFSSMLETGVFLCFHLTFIIATNYFIHTRTLAASLTSGVLSCTF